jgi:hypothetical protein
MNGRIGVTTLEIVCNDVNRRPAYEAHRARLGEARLFAAFLREEYDADCLAFYLQSRSLLSKMCVVWLARLAAHAEAEACAASSSSSSSLRRATPGFAA